MKGEIQLKSQIPGFETRLQKTEGWSSMEKDDRDWLMQKTSNVLKFGMIEVVGSVNSAFELAEVRERLKTLNKMSLNDYLKSVFGESRATAMRRLKHFRVINEAWGPEVIKVMRNSGEAMLSGIPGVGLKDIATVAGELPAPKTKEPKVIQGFLVNDVRAKIQERVQERRRKKGNLSVSPKMRQKIAFNAMRRMIHEANLPDAEAKKEWLQPICGWIMQSEGISGVLRISKMPIPDGMIIRRGAPKGPRKKKTSA